MSSSSRHIQDVIIVRQGRRFTEELPLSKVDLAEVVLYRSMSVFAVVELAGVTPRASSSSMALDVRILGLARGFDPRSPYEARGTRPAYRTSCSSAGPASTSMRTPRTQSARCPISACAAAAVDLFGRGLGLVVVVVVAGVGVDVGAADGQASGAARLVTMRHGSPFSSDASPCPGWSP
jgi:hypothetical protein